MLYLTIVNIILRHCHSWLAPHYFDKLLTTEDCKYVFDFIFGVKTSDNSQEIPSIYLVLCGTIRRSATNDDVDWCIDIIKQF